MNHLNDKEKSPVTESVSGSEGGSVHRLWRDVKMAVRGNDERIGELIQEHIEAAATGNHSPRRHPIHVPTAPGQPVRG